jgi:CRISPR-associated endonuclease Csn1
MMKKSELPDDFIDRQLRESQYIAREITTRLKAVCRKVVSTTGSVTDYLRFEWGLDTILHDLNLEKYRTMGKTFQDTDHTGSAVERISEWTKRNDHRHHAVDAIVIACTKQGMIQKLNTLHSIKGGMQDELKGFIAQNESWRIKAPWSTIRPQAKQAVEKILVSFKADRKVVSRHVNKIKIKGGELKQITYTPRGFLHKETIYGQISRYKKIKLDKKFTQEQYVLMAQPYERFLVEKHLEKYENIFDLAFSSKTLKNDPVYIDETNKRVLDIISVFDHKFVYRVELNQSFDKVEDIVDKGIKRVLYQFEWVT